MARLPWIQLGAAFDLAPRLEGLLGVSYLEALGLLAQLDRVAVELAELGLFPGGRAGAQLAPAVRWPAARADELVKALVEVGKAEVGPEGVRILGLEWAGRALASQDASRARAEASRERRARTVREPCANRARTSPEGARTVREGAPLDQDLDQEEKQLLPPADAAGTGQAEVQPGGITPTAGELDLGPEATVAAKTKPRGKKPNANHEASAAPTGGFRRQLTDALDAAFHRATGTKYPWENRRNYSAGALGTGQKPGVVMELAKRHGIPEVAGRFELGVREAHREHAPGRRRVANLWELPDAWAHLTDAVPVEPAAPREHAWMTGEVGERWRRAVAESGRAPAFGEVAKLVVAAEQDIDVLRLTVQDENARAWIGQRTPDPWSNKPATSLLDMLQEWLGEVTIEVQPGGGA